MWQKCELKPDPFHNFPNGGHNFNIKGSFGLGDDGRTNAPTNEHRHVANTEP